MIVYIATNQINGKMYIGQTIGSLNKRITGHTSNARTGSNYCFHRAIRKYGAENFKWEIIRICDSIESLNAYEQYYVLYYNSMDNGYNLTSGGDNCTYSDMSKKKMSDNHADFKGDKHPMWGVSRASPMEGKKHKPESIQKMRDNTNYSGENHPMWGRKHTKESKERMSTTRIERKLAEGENHAMYGKHHTEATKKKISIANGGKNHWNYGKHLSIETKEKIKQANLGRTVSEETREKLRNASKEYWKKKKENKDGQNI